MSGGLEPCTVWVSVFQATQLSNVFNLCRMRSIGAVVYPTKNIHEAFWWISIRKFMYPVSGLGFYMNLKDYFINLFPMWISIETFMNFNYILKQVLVENMERNCISLNWNNLMITQILEIHLDIPLPKIPTCNIH